MFMSLNLQRHPHTMHKSYVRPFRPPKRHKKPTDLREEILHAEYTTFSHVMEIVNNLHDVPAYQ